MGLLNNFLHPILKNKEITLSLSYLFYGISIFVSLILVLYGLLTIDFRNILSLSNLLPALLLIFGFNLSRKQIKSIISLDESVLSKIEKFVKEKEKVIGLTIVLFVVTLILLQLKIKFVTTAFALPLAFLTNLTFIIEIFMKNKLSIGFLTFTLDLALYYVQVLYLFLISNIFFKIFKK